MNRKLDNDDSDACISNKSVQKDESFTLENGRVDEMLEQDNNGTNVEQKML